MSRRSKAFLILLLGIGLSTLAGSLILRAQDFKHAKKNGVEVLVPNYPIESGQTLGANGGGTFGGLWNKANPSTNSILQLEDLGTRDTQLIGFGVEQFLNPVTSPAAYFNFGQVTELDIPTSNTVSFTGQETATYGSFSDFGSGAFNTGFGGGFEGFNPGAATALLIGGVQATANNGGVATGVPLPEQFPSNNGNVTNLRAFDGLAKNWSSGTVTNGVAFYAEAPQNVGGGTFTNAYGLFVADMTAATHNFAIKTGVGKVSIGDAASFNSTVSMGSTAAIGNAPMANVGLIVYGPNPALTGTYQFGIQSAIQTTLESTLEGSAIVARADTQSGVYTQALNTGVHVTTPTIGAGSAITEWDGLRIDAAPRAGTKCSIKLFGSASGSTCINTSAAAGGTASIVLSASLVTTAAAFDDIALLGMTASGHCSLTATNAAAAASITTTFISAKTRNQITVSHAPVAAMKYDVMCSPL